MSRILPILFNTDMVRAILDGKKTVTRRILKLPKYIKPQEDGLYTLFADGTCYENQSMDEIIGYLKPPYQSGDILYVRETWKILDYLDRLSLKFEYEADGKISNFIDFTNDRLQMFLKYIGKKGWRPALFMPKEAARIWLKVTDVRVERLQGITEKQAKEEGFTSKDEFIKTFLKMYPDCTEESWLWVIEFERCEKPEPCILKGIEPAEDKRPCIGYSLSEDDDEPCEMCKGCSKCSGNDMEG